MIWQPRTKRRPPVRISFYSGSTVLPAKDWSPEQIPGWLKQSYPDDESLRVSHETIYRTLFLQARGALKQELVRHMRSQRRIRRSRRASIHRAIASRIVDAVSIRERPLRVSKSFAAAYSQPGCGASRGGPGGWQRGSNENTNGLLRQYLPKKADLSCYSQADLDEIALRLDQRPRKTSGFQTPAGKLQASVASIP